MATRRFWPADSRADRQVREAAEADMLDGILDIALPP